MQIDPLKTARKMVLGFAIWCFCISSGCAGTNKITVKVNEESGPVNKLLFGNNLLGYDPVTVEVMAPFEAVLHLLHAVQAKGSFLALVQLTLESADPENNLLRVRLTVAGLRVNAEAKVAPAEAPGGGGGGGGGAKKPPAPGWRPGR